VSDRAIWKYVLEPGDTSSVYMPEGSQVLSVDMQDGNMCIWALVDPLATPTWHAFRVRGTGHDAHGLDAAQFIDTVMMETPYGDKLVFHVFGPFLDG